MAPKVLKSVFSMSFEEWERRDFICRVMQKASMLQARRLCQTFEAWCWDLWLLKNQNCITRLQCSRYAWNLFSCFCLPSCKHQFILDHVIILQIDPLIHGRPTSTKVAPINCFNLLCDDSQNPAWRLSTLLICWIASQRGSKAFHFCVSEFELDIL